MVKVRCLLARDDFGWRTDLYGLILSKARRPALLYHLSNRSLRGLQLLMILTIHFVVCMSRVLGRALHLAELELSRLLKQVEMSLQGGILYCRSASHSTDKVGIELAAVLGGSGASIDDTPWR